MSSSSKTGPKRSSSTKTKKNTTKAASTKTKKSTTKKKIVTTKTGKTKTVTKSVKEKTAKTTTQNNSAIEKILTNIECLGNQIFALSPFSQYYDEWLTNLRQAVTKFETSSNIKVDTNFTTKSKQALLEIQTTLSKLRIQEATLTEKEKTLQTIKQDLKKLEADYTKKSQELNNNQNINIQELTTKIKTLENDIATQEKLKFSFFQFNAKKIATKKLEQTKQSLKETKKQLETASQNLSIEQDKLQKEYITKKQEFTAESDALCKEAEQLEVDTSIEARKEICTRLINIINEIFKNQTAKLNN